MTASRSHALLAADRLRQATSDGRPCEPVRRILPAGDVEVAYEVQGINHRRDIAAGRRLVGWKIGLTNPAVQRQLGVGMPDTGALFADAQLDDGDPIPPGRLLQPRIEAEVAFVLEHALTVAPVTPLDVTRATSFVLPALEIVDSRIEAWDIDIVDTVADNASCGMYVIGSQPSKLSEVDVGAVEMTLSDSDGVVSTGSGRQCLGNPLNAVTWLANRALANGSPLQEGQVVLSGALGPMVDLRSEQTYQAEIEGLGHVRTSYNVQP